MEPNDKDVKRYKPGKNSPKSGNQALNMSRARLSDMLSDEDKDLRRREENYLFRGYGTMMDTSETLDFSEGTDSD